MHKYLRQACVTALSGENDKHMKCKNTFCMKSQTMPNVLNSTVSKSCVHVLTANEFKSILYFA